MSPLGVGGEAVIVEAVAGRAIYAVGDLIPMTFYYFYANSPVRAIK